MTSSDWLCAVLLMALALIVITGCIMAALLDFYRLWNRDLHLREVEEARRAHRPR